MLQAIVSSLRVVLQLFLSSPKAILKFAAIKTLNKLAMTQPAAVTACNVDMENLITDSNRSIATYAITTLLKVSSTALVIAKLTCRPETRLRSTDS